MRNKRFLFFILTALTLAFVLTGGNENRAQAATASVTATAAANYNIVYLGDGALQNSAGGWNLPAQGTCPAGAANGYSGIDTRPECVALRLNIVQGSCTSPNYSWTTGGVCNDLVNTTQAACQAEEDRLWNPGTGVCSIVMFGDDRNNVTCALHGGTWVTAGTCTGSWVMPAGTTYNPALLTSNGAGDQCLRCHNTRTQYNGPRVRDTEDTIYMGHKNMARNVNYCSKPAYTNQGDCTANGGSWIPGPWGGPDFSCSNPTFTDEQTCYLNGGSWNPTIYPSDDSGNLFDWGAGTITVGGSPKELVWIYGDWLAALPRAVYKTAGSASFICTNPLYTAQATCTANGGQWINNAGASYSCGRCHTTGWTSDEFIQAMKEPEKSHPGITFARDGVGTNNNVVNLTGGVSGDPNRYSSWDQFGITCTRCHSSAIDLTRTACTGLVGGQTTCTTLGGSWSGSSSTCSNITPAQCTGNGGTVANYVAPVGMSSHHNNLTAPDINSGACSDIRWTSQTECLAAGASWVTACSSNPTNAVCTQAITTEAACTAVVGAVWVPAPGWCSNAFFTDQASCVANGTPTPYVWQEGWCTRPDKDSVTCTGGSGTSALTWRVNGSQASCQVAGATWSFGSCSMAGVCNVGGGTITDKAACDAVTGQFAYITDIVRCIDAGGHWTGNHSTRGQMITNLCMDCHRQETGGLPYDSTNPGTVLKVGPAHGDVAFVSHPHGNMFLNSAHGKFSGTFAQVGSAKLGSGYGSDFMKWGEAKNTGNGCTGCHDVHSSTVAGLEPFHEECTECHVSNDAEKVAEIPQVDIAAINHLAGTDTPLEHSSSKPNESCEICHMPGGTHLWRINTSASYSTYPMPAALTTTVNANTAPDGDYTNAVWTDLDAACGQCHGGGTATASTTGNVTGNSDIVVVTSSAGFLPNERIRIYGAGALYYDGEGQAKREDFDTFIVSVPNATSIKLAGKPSKTLAGLQVVMNPTYGTANYRTKAQLAPAAVGMHSSAAVNYAVTFSTSISGRTVTATPFVDCGGCSDTFTYEWNWGDGSPVEEDNPGVHTYATGGTKSITLDVKLNGLSVGSVTRSVTLTSGNVAPIADATCTWDENLWTLQVDDASTDENMATLQISVNWGDGTTKSFGTPGSTFSHTYIQPGTYTAELKAVDSALKYSKYACPDVTPAYFSLSGTVKNKLGTANIPSASVSLMKGTNVVKTVYSAADGTFTFTNLKPAVYKIKVVKAGYTFTNPAWGPTQVGPSVSGITIQATAP